MENYIEYCLMENDSPKFQQSYLTDQDADECLKRYKTLSRKLEIENLFDVFVEEFITFKSLLSEVQFSQEFSQFSEVYAYIESQRIRTKLNVSYLSILNIGKLVLDRFYYENSKFSILNEIDESLVDSFLLEREKVFNENQSYLLSCNLRNLCQHKLLPINRLTFQFPSLGVNGKDVTSGFHIPLVISSLKRSDKKLLLKKLDPDFKQELLEKDKIDLNRVIDGYFEGIFDQMTKLRSLATTSIRDAEDYFARLNEKYFDKKLLFSPASIFINKERRFSSDFEWFRVAHYLEEKNNIHYFKRKNLIRTQYIGN